MPLMVRPIMQSPPQFVPFKKPNGQHGGDEFLWRAEPAGDPSDFLRLVAQQQPVFGVIFGRITPESERINLRADP